MNYKYIVMFLVAAFSDLATAREVISLVPGVTVGGRSGLAPHVGPDVSLLVGKCQDSCAGYGPTLGVINPLTQEYFIGVAAGAAYMGSFWADVEVRLRRGKVAGVAVNYALGFVAMVYAGGGYDREDKSVFAELGLTFKVPVTGI